jgi:hypothetical protein
MHALAILPLWLLVWCLARNVFLILVMCPIMKCVMRANRPNITNFPILCPLASLRFPYNLSSQMCGVLLILLLVTIISMLVLLMTSASLLGFICLNTNLRSFISFKSFQCMVECLFDHKILAMQTNWEGGGVEYQKLNPFFTRLAYPIMCHVHTHINKMARPSANITILLK